MQLEKTSFDYTKDSNPANHLINTEDEKSGQIMIPIGTRNEGFVIEDFSSIPCSLIVGTTGSGKSTFVKSILVEIMQKYTPDQVRFMVIDSRRVDYSLLSENPYLYIPIVHDPIKASTVIQYSLIETRKRMNILDQMEDLPHLFIILDDFGEISLTNDTITDLIQVLQIARRAKIHYWIITSTPSSNILPSDLKANINHRIVFRVSSKSISRAVLDGAGAETLKTPGEMIVKLNNDIIKCEAIHFEDSAIAVLSKRIAENHALNSPPSRIKPSYTEPEGLSSTIGEDGKDVLFTQAVDAIIEARIATVSVIQRKLKIGYSRAARLMDQIEAEGIVGPFEGSKPRKILFTQEQWLTTKKGVSQNNAISTNKPAHNWEKQYDSIPIKHRSILIQQEIALSSGNSIRTIGNMVVAKNNHEEVSFSGDSIQVLVYKKPGFLKKGFLLIQYSSFNSVGKQRENSEKYIRILFDSKDLNKVQLFCNQLSHDINKSVVEL